MDPVNELETIKLMWTFLAALGGLLITFGGMLIGVSKKLISVTKDYVKTTTTLNMTISEVNEKFNEYTTEAKIHEKDQDRAISKLELKVVEHDTRITNLEKK